MSTQPKRRIAHAAVTSAVTSSARAASATIAHVHVAQDGSPEDVDLARPRKRMRRLTKLAIDSNIVQGVPSKSHIVSVCL